MLLKNTKIEYVNYLSKRMKIKMEKKTDVIDSK